MRFLIVTSLFAITAMPLPAAGPAVASGREMGLACEDPAAFSAAA